VPDPAGPGARVRGMFQPRADSTAPGKEKDSKGKEKDGKGKAKDKDGTKAVAPETPAAPLTLKPAGDLAPAPAK
jgi:hypothetical protein